MLLSFIKDLILTQSSVSVKNKSFSSHLSARSAKRIQRKHTARRGSRSGPLFLSRHCEKFFCLFLYT